MTLLFDNNLSPDLADAFEHLGVSAKHLSAEFAPDAKDSEWIPQAAQRGFVIVTCDCNIQKREAEREVYRRNRMRGLFLARAFAGMRLLDQAKWLLWRWEEIEKVLNTAKPGEAYLVKQKGVIRPL